MADAVAMVAVALTVLVEMGGEAVTAPLVKEVMEEMVGTANMAKAATVVTVAMARQVEGAEVPVAVALLEMEKTGKRGVQDEFDEHED